MTAPPREEAPQELRPAESDRNVFAAIRLDIGFVVGAALASLVFPAFEGGTVATGPGGRERPLPAGGQGELRCERGHAARPLDAPKLGPAIVYERLPTDSVAERIPSAASHR